WDRLLVIDTKGDAAAVLPNMRAVSTHVDAMRALPGRVIYQPSRADMDSHRRKVNEILERLWRLGGRHAVLIHELGDAAAESSEKETPALFEIYRKGASFGIPIIACTQRPRNIPKVARTESSHVICFALLDPDDRDVMAGHMGAGVREPLPLPFDRTFWHRG